MFRIPGRCSLCRPLLVAALLGCLGCGRDAAMPHRVAPAVHGASVGPVLVSRLDGPREPGRFEFRVANPSSSRTARPTIVARSCTCVDAVLDRDELPPGEHATLLVSYPFALATEEKDLDVTIEMGLPVPRQHFRLSVQTLARLAVHPTELVIERKPNGESSARRFDVALIQPADETETEVRIAAPPVGVDVAHCSGASAELLHEGRFVRRVHQFEVSLGLDEAASALSRVVLEVQAGEETAPVKLHVSQRPVIAVAPASLFFASAERKGVQEVVVLRSARPFRVLGLSGPAWLRLVETPEEASPLHRLRLDVDFGAVPEEFVSERIVVLCDHPEQPRLELPVVARVLTKS